MSAKPSQELPLSTTPPLSTCGEAGIYVTPSSPIHRVEQQIHHTACLVSRELAKLGSTMVSMCNTAIPGSSGWKLTNMSGSDLRIGIVHARWNTKIIDALMEGALKKLKEAGVKGQIRSIGLCL